jgi:hypothetical protein
VDAAIRTAYDLGDIAAVRELLAMIDDWAPRHLAPRLSAGRTLVRARLADRDGYGAADPAFAAVGALRERSTLTTSLIAWAVTSGTSPALVRSKPPKRLSARPATSPGRQRCQPLLDRGRRPDARGTADRGPMVTAPGPGESATVRHR